jgi:aspartate/glutamate racemase
MYQRWAGDYELEIVSPPAHIRDSVNELIFDELTSGVVPDAGNCSFCKQANATAFRQWRSWLRGADLNRRPLGYAI